MDCVQVFDVSMGSMFEWAPFCSIGPNVETLIATAEWVPIGGVVVALVAVLVALFKDELWHWRHAPGFEVTLAEAGVVPGGALELRVKNTSNRLAAEEATVRIVELEPHPLEGAIGPKGISHVVPVDQLLPRTSGETSYGIAPQSQARLPLVTLRDGWKRSDPVLAEVAGTTLSSVAARRDDPGMLLLPSAEDREHWSAQHPDLAKIMGAPAMIRLEVAASNVPAKLYTVKLTRDPSAPVGDELPMSPGLRSGVFGHELIEGSEPYNQTPHAGSLPVRRTVAETERDR